MDFLRWFQLVNFFCGVQLTGSFTQKHNPGPKIAAQ